MICDMLRQNFVKNSTLQKEKEKKKQRVENDENNVWKKAQGCCHFNCKNFRKRSCTQNINQQKTLPRSSSSKEDIERTKR